MDQLTDTAVLTPDFYDYAWVTPSSLVIHGRFLRLRWDDGVELDAFDLWLRESAVGTGGVDPATREGLIDPAEHNPATELVDAHIATDGSVHVLFGPDQVSCIYHPGWLRHVADGQHHANSWLPVAVAWSGNELTEPPTHDGATVLADDAAFCDWINDLVAFGLARLRNLPDDPDVAMQLASKIGTVRDTNFGPIWDVKADSEMAGSADTNSTAYTNLRLGPHTDLPTRETPPGFQFLHCFANEAQGGNSTMADGAAVVAAIKADHPDHYEALTTLNWVFFNRGPGIDHRWSGPMIDLGAQGSPLTLRAFYPVRGFPDMAPADMPRAYVAMRCFSVLAASNRFQISYPFEAGDMVCFDNRRVLHGRDPFSTGGKRHLRGIYIDHDDVLSATRVANRKRVEAARTNQWTKESPND
jgi:gamma-butyrobetaine dioxygenase